MAELTHINQQGRGKMVDVSAKDTTSREAVARGFITLSPKSMALLKTGEGKKGDVLGVAQIAGVMGAKKTADLIPLCHPLNLTGVDLEFSPDEDRQGVEVEARVRVKGPTGVEMEALTAVATACLTIYDMCKAIDKEMSIGPIYLVEKKGGRSGHYLREGK